MYVCSREVDRYSATCKHTQLKDRAEAAVEQNNRNRRLNSDEEYKWIERWRQGKT